MKLHKDANEEWPEPAKVELCCSSRKKPRFNFLITSVNITNYEASLLSHNLHTKECGVQRNLIALLCFIHCVFVDFWQITGQVCTCLFVMMSRYVRESIRVNISLNLELRKIWDRKKRNRLFLIQTRNKVNPCILTTCLKKRNIFELWALCLLKEFKSSLSDIHIFPTCTANFHLEYTQVFQTLYLASSLPLCSFQTEAPGEVCGN